MGEPDHPERSVGDLSREVLACDISQPSALVDVLKEHLAGQLLAALDHARHPTVGDAELVLDSTLASKDEPDRRAADLDVPVAQRRQAERAVFPGVLLVADAREGRLQ